MSDKTEVGLLWHKVARDGTFAVLLSYLTYFLVNTVTTQLNAQTDTLQKILTAIQESNELHRKDFAISRSQK